MAYSGWELNETDRAKLLGRFPPVYPDVLAHHVTLNPGVKSDSEPPPAAVFNVVGVVDDGRGVQALVVTVNGSLRRPDGGFFHMTWSVDRAAGFKPVHSNDALAACPVQPVDAVDFYPRPFVSK